MDGVRCDSVGSIVWRRRSVKIIRTTRPSDYANSPKVVQRYEATLSPTSLGSSVPVTSKSARWSRPKLCLLTPAADAATYSAVTDGTKNGIHTMENARRWGVLAKASSFAG